MYWVYLLLSDSGDFYVGQTENLRVRLRNHNKGQVFTTFGRQWRLVAAVKVQSRAEAFQVEGQRQRQEAAELWVRASRRRIEKVWGCIPQEIRVLRPKRFEGGVSLAEWPKINQ